MHEILFKAKEIGTDKWVEGYVVKISEDDYRIVTGEDIKWSWTERCDYDGVMTRVNPETICQYTGLTDKNGNKIWENDVVRNAYYPKYIGKVVYGEFNCSCCNGVYGWTFESDCYECDIRKPEETEVIGNIFDNNIGDFNGC